MKPSPLHTLISLTCCLFAFQPLSANSTKETFDTNPPTWNGQGQKADYIATNFAGGSRSGEAGIQPIAGSETIYYADTTIGSFDLSNPLSASGRLIWRLNNGEKSQRGLHLGFFNKESFSTVLGLSFHAANNARAFILQEPSRGSISLNRQTPIGTLITGTSSEPNDTTSYTFNILWEPQGGDYNSGHLVARIDGIGEASIALTPEERAEFNSDLNAFGFLAPDGNGVNSQFMLDDVTYTSANHSVTTAPAPTPTPATPQKHASASSLSATVDPDVCSSECSHGAPTEAELQARFRSSTDSQTAFEALSDDLANAGSPALSRVFSEDYTATPSQFGSLNRINDGQVGDPSEPSDGLLQTHGNYAITFELDTSSARSGYDIEEIRVIAAWPEQRSAQKVAIEIRTPDCTKFHRVGTFTKAPFNQSANGASLLELKGDPIATGAEAIRIHMLPLSDSAGTNFGVYREVDIVGKPSATGTVPQVNNIEASKRASESQALEKTRKVAKEWQMRGQPVVLEDFLTAEIPTQDPDTLLFPYDAPTITNNRIWAQAVNTEKRSGILDLDDVWVGTESVDGTLRYTLKGIWNRGQPLLSTLKVRVDGSELAPPPVETADWMPNTIIRHASQAGLEFTGTVKTAAGYQAFLKELLVTNPSERSISVQLDFLTSTASGEVAYATPPQNVAQGNTRHDFGQITLQPGETRRFQVVLSYEPDTAEKLAQNFAKEWLYADNYWNALLEDAFDPLPGPFLSGGVPDFQTTDHEARKFYNYGAVTALMVMMHHTLLDTDANQYVVAMPDAPYSRWVFFWDSSYAAETLALMDPQALRTTLVRMCEAGIQVSSAFDVVTGGNVGQWYGANFGSFVRLLRVYVDWTGDFALLDETVNGMTVMEHALAASKFNDERPQRDGLYHANSEHHLFDRNTVVGYEHYVAWPNMADAWGKRQIADLLEHQGKTAQADTLRRQAAERAQAVVEQLYNTAPGYEGTWKQIHEDGTVLQIRHGIDFMHGGMSLTDYLSDSQKQMMRDWWHEQIFSQSRDDDVWVISQDRRDGNNGWHQMEHNGQGAYPGWPYHYAWALHEMGYHQEVAALLEKITGIVRYGAIGQGYSRDGRRSRSGWVEIAGAFPVPYIVNFLFGMEPAGDTLKSGAHPVLESGASLSGLRWRGTIYDVSADGTVEPRP